MTRKRRHRKEIDTQRSPLGPVLLKWLFAAALPPLAAGYAVETWRLATSSSMRSEGVLAFGVGAAVVILVWAGARRTRGLREAVDFFATLEHEITHLVAGLLFFKRPHSLRASATGAGEVVLYGNNFVILLAPYFLPTVSFAMLPLALVLRNELWTAFLAALGATAGYHIASTASELSPRQTDLQRSGFLFSAVFLPVANLVCYGALVAFAAGGFDGLGRFLRDGAMTAVSLVSRLAA